MIALDQLEKEFQKHLKAPNLRLFLKPDWGSGQLGSKTLIRQQIETELPAQVKPEISELDKIPELKSGFLSISHCFDVGGFAYSTGLPLGFDVEITSRVTNSIINRVASPQELKSAPSAASLWTAKEAIFKSLRTFKQPQVVSQIETSWISSGVSQVEMFTLNKASDFTSRLGKGCVIHHRTHSYAIFLFHS